VSWGSLNEEEKIKHCITFRSTISFREKFIRCEGDKSKPWASWFLLSVAASKSFWSLWTRPSKILIKVESKEAPQSSATRPPQSSPSQGLPPGESASEHVHASKSSAEDPVLPKVTQSDSLRPSQGANVPARPGNQQSAEDFGATPEFRGLPYDPVKK
jgi:hypothetical protein